MKTKDFKKHKRCRYCKAIENLTVDHKVPICQGGKNHESNFQTLCESCNKIKSGLSHKQVLRYFNWFLKVQEGRTKAGKGKYTLK